MESKKKALKYWTPSTGLPHLEGHGAITRTRKKEKKKKEDKQVCK